MRSLRIREVLVGSGKRSILRAAITGVVPVIIVIGAVNAVSRLAARATSSGSSAGPAVEEPRTAVPPSVSPKFKGELTSSEFLRLGLNSASDLKSSGEWLLVLDPLGKRPVLAIDTSAQNHAFDITLPVGSPGVPWQRVGPGPQPNQFILRTALDDSAQLIELNKGFTFGVPLVRNSGIRGAEKTTSLFALGQHRIVATGLLADRLLQFYQYKDGALVAAESVDGPLFPEFPAEKVALSLNRGKIALNPKDHRIVQVFLFSSRLHVYSQEGELERAIAGPIDVKGVVETKFDSEQGFDRHMQGNKGTRYCYLDVSADEHAIYALFSGRTQGGYKGSVSVTSNQLHIFDWGGRFLGAWLFDQDLAGITVASPGVIFGRLLDVPGLVKYDLHSAMGVGEGSATR